VAPKTAVLTRVLVKQPYTDIPPLALLDQFPEWRIEWPTAPKIFVARRRGRTVDLSLVELRHLGERARFGRARWQSSSTEPSAIARVNRACDEKLYAGYAEIFYDARRKRVWSIQNLGLDPSLLLGPDIAETLAQTAKLVRSQAPKNTITRVLARESKRPTGRPAYVFIVRRNGNALDIEDTTLRTPIEVATFLQPKRRLFADEAVAKQEMERLCSAKLRAGFAEFVYDAPADRVRCPADENLWPRPLFSENVDDALIDTARLHPPQLEPDEDPETVLTELVTGQRAETVRERYTNALALKSGRLLITDPFHPHGKPLGLRLAPGRYSLLVTRARDERRSALAATVVVRDGEPTSWQLADEVAVDVAMVSFSGAEIAQALEQRGPDLYDQLEVPEGRRIGKLSFGSLGNLVAVDTGSDGRFPIYYGKHGRQIVCVTVFFANKE
jgi:hypothetical protein